MRGAAAEELGASWGRALGDVVGTAAFAALMARVEEAYGRERVLPAREDVFAAFRLCPFDAVKVVVIGQDPYPGEGQAHGLSFSVREGVAVPRSLGNIFKEIEAEFGTPRPAGGELSRWARQGVLLLNDVLTVRAGEAGSHGGLGWQWFTDAAVERLSAGREHVVFMLWGARAGAKGGLVDGGRHLVLRSAHPSPLSARRGFFGNGHFAAANRYLEAHGAKGIEW